MIAREELYHLIDSVPEDELPAVRSYLSYLVAVKRDPVLKALLNAPLDDELETEEERIAVQEAEEDLASGRVVSDDALRRELGL